MVFDVSAKILSSSGGSDTEMQRGYPMDFDEFSAPEKLIILYFILFNGP